MSKPTDKLTDEEIDRRFAECEARPDPRQSAALKKWRDATATLNEAQNRGVMQEIDRLLKETPEGWIPLDALLPSHDGATIHKQFFVAPLFERFLTAAAALVDFRPDDDVNQAKKVEFGKWFASSLNPNTKDYRSVSDKAGEALCRAAGDLVRDAEAIKSANALSRLADIEYAVWFAENLCKHWDNDYVTKVGAALFDCAYEHNAARSRNSVTRNPNNFKDRLVAEANRFKRKKSQKTNSDWRADKPDLAAHFEECFRVLSKLFPSLSRGQQPTFEPSSRFVYHVMELGGEKVRKSLSTLGVKYNNESGSGTPSPGRAGLIRWVKSDRETFILMGVTPEGVRKAFRSLDRRHQGKRGGGEKN